jgi:hypothetical protein
MATGMEFLSDTGPEQEDPRWFEVNLPEDVEARLSDKQVGGRTKSVPSNVPLNRLAAIDGVCLQAHKVPFAGSEIFDISEIVQSLKENHRVRDADWWEGFGRGLGSTTFSAVNGMDHLHLPKEWLVELGEEIAPVE